MLKVNLKKLKSYGDRLDDGAVQLSFTLPVPASPEAKEAARQYAEHLNLEKVNVCAMEPVGAAFTSFVVYGNAPHNIDFTKIRVPKLDVPQMGYAELKEYMARNLDTPIVVIGAATGSDAHTVGIDAIMNMKGFAGDYGLERYPLFKTCNLRSQLSNAELVKKAAELSADAVLVSQVVTQRDTHIKNLKEFLELARKEGGLKREVILVIGGPRIDHGLAQQLGFDAGFGYGTVPSQVASFIVHEFMKRHGIKERPVMAPPPPHTVPKPEPESASTEETPLPEARGREGAPATGVKKVFHGKKRRRRRGRRGGRHRRKRENK